MTNDDPADIDPEQANEIMTAMRAIGRMTALEAGRTILSLQEEVRSLRRTLDVHAELTAAAHREGPQRYLRALLLTRKELKAMRSFIEAIANGRMRPWMSDARYFLSELDASKTKGHGDE